MSGLISAPPFSVTEPVTEVFHGVPVADPYRWLENRDSARTRHWIEAQTEYARAYLDNISGRERIRDRIGEFLAVETYDSLQEVGRRYFFRKRLPDQEQPAVFMRDGAGGLKTNFSLDPGGSRKAGKYTAVKLLRVSADGRLLLYEVKEGGERAGTFACLDIETRKTLPDVLPRGYLRGFVFAPDSKSFYYVHESSDCDTGPSIALRTTIVLGTAISSTTSEIFCAGEPAKSLRLCLISEQRRTLGFLGEVADSSKRRAPTSISSRSIPRSHRKLWSRIPTIALVPVYFSTRSWPSPIAMHPISAS